MSTTVIDTFEFSRRQETRQGEVVLASLPRLAAESLEPSDSLRWSLEGGADRIGHLQLTLTLSGTTHLMCQRCLTPFAFDMASKSVLILAKDEVQADEIDALLSDDSIDVIVGAKALDIYALVEDEALLKLPLSPKHDVCPDLTKIALQESTAKPSPFAVLKDLM